MYYFNNISSLKIDGTNFSLNNEEFKKIEGLSKNISPQTLVIFWQFTVKTIEELEIVSNQNLSIEMFLIRLMYLVEISKQKIETGEQLKEDLISQNVNNDEKVKVKFNNDDENLEVTPKNLRLRKKYLDPHVRKKMLKNSEEAKV